MPASRPSPIVPALVWFHRWLGIATCLIFAVWFASGAVMVFKPFPSISPAQRLEFAQRVDTGSVRISPAEALQSVGKLTGDVRLIQRAGVPAYVVQASGRAAVVDARNGARAAPLTVAALRAAGPAIDYDQWIVPNSIDPYRPVFRFPRHDRAGTVDYVSALTGELVQRTTASDRAWNWAGSVLHWVYFTPLRSNWAAWDQFVWWLSLVALLVAVAGVVLGIVRTVAAARRRRGSLTYFRARWMRWHHLLGLFVGLFVLTWIFSGWLSMDHGRLFSRGEATIAQANAFAGSAPLESVTMETLRRIGPARQVAFSQVGGAQIISVSRPNGRIDRLDAHGAPLSDRSFNALLETAIKSAWPGATPSRLERVNEDNLLRLHEGWPETVRRAKFAGPGLPDLYFDASDGRLLTVMDASRRNYAWAYYALHTLKFPGLIEHPEVRKLLVLMLLLAGFTFSLTGVVIGWRRLRLLRS